jgi:ABC-2 type transport system permease protein
MNDLIRALRAEQIKLRHTLSLWLVPLAPAVILLLALAQFSFAKVHRPDPIDHIAVWKSFSNGMFVLWNFLMLPLFVTLQAALLAGLEHGNQQWKHLLALPMPRRTHYAAKFCVLVAMTAASTLLMGAALPLLGWAVMHLQPGYGLAGMPPWDWLAGRTVASIAAAGVLIALQGWVALRWQNFTVALFVGIAGTVAAFVIAQSEKTGRWFPWSMPAQVFAFDGAHLWFVVIAGLAVGAPIAAFAMWDCARREYA